MEAVDRVCRISVAVAKSPPALVSNRVDDGHSDSTFQPFELANDDRAVRPGTCVRDIEMVAAGDRRKSGTAVGAHPMAKRVLLPDERPICGLLARELRFDGSHAV